MFFYLVPTQLVTFILLAMQYSPALLSSAANHLKKVLNLDMLPASDIHEFQHKVTQTVLHLLQTDLSRLLHILYRIDVEEQQVKRAMQAETKTVMAERIAQLIIKRELQKAQTRFNFMRK